MPRWSSWFWVGCCTAWGAVAGYFIQGKLNESRSFGFANMPEEFVKLILWIVAGACIGGLFGLLTKHLVK